MNYEKILCEFQNFIKAYLSLEHKQHRILDLNLSEVHLLKVAEQNPNYTLIEYAEKLKVSRSAITQLVNLLEKKDCVKKNDCIFFEQLSELMSDITSTWEEYDGM